MSIKKNNKIIEVETKNGKFLFVKPTKKVSYMDNDQFLVMGHKLSWMDTDVDIPEHGFGFNSVMSKLNEGMCKIIVEGLFDKSFKNYYDPNPNNTYAPTFDFDTAKESFDSLMKKVGIYTVNPFKKPNPNDYNDDFGNYDHDLAQWKAAEKRTASDWLILKVKEMAENLKINVNKPIRFMPDRGTHRYDILFIDKILSFDGDTCLCMIKKENDFPSDARTLFDLKTGRVLTENIEFGNYYAENYDKTK